MKIEKRSIVSEMTVEDEKRTIVGYAVKWNELSEQLGFFREKFSKGAFKDSLLDKQQMALWNHNTDVVLGSTRNQTLRLSEDELGLRFEIDLANTTQANDIYELVKRGDINGVSFGFYAELEDWEDRSDTAVRTINRADLIEISPTPFPAYSQSEVNVRSLEERYQEFKKKSEEEDKNNEWITNFRKKINGGI
jgi:hypothetical protein